MDKILYQTFHTYINKCLQPLRNHLDLNSYGVSLYKTRDSNQERNKDQKEDTRISDKNYGGRVHRPFLGLLVAMAVAVCRGDPSEAAGLIPGARAEDPTYHRAK